MWLLLHTPGQYQIRTAPAVIGRVAIQGMRAADLRVAVTRSATVKVTVTRSATVAVAVTGSAIVAVPRQ